MSDKWRELRLGDRIRLIRVPLADLRQREEELRRGVEMAGWTADTLERILALDPVVIIDHIDDFGVPWFRRKLIAKDGTEEFHSLTIVDDDSWQRVGCTEQRG